MMTTKLDPRYLHILMISALGALFVAACSQSPGEQPSGDVSESKVVRRIAEAHLSPTDGYETDGIITFVQEAEGIRIIADVRNLPSDGSHGFHIHETGDCSAADASSAGGHFNPEREPHAGPREARRHVGDLGNLESSEAGSAMYVRVDEQIRFDGQNSIIGKAVVVHAKADDLMSQPSGDAGPRVACGVVRWAVTPDETGRE